MTATWADIEDAATLFRDAAGGARGTGNQRALAGDTFGEHLALLRSDVYEQAAAIIVHADIAAAARILMDHARLHAVGRSGGPLAGYDDRCRGYVQSFAWQWAAWQLDPTRPEVQPPWN